MKFFEKLRFLIEKEGVGKKWLKVSTPKKTYELSCSKSYIKLKLTADDNTYNQLLTQYDELFFIAHEEIFDHTFLLGSVFEEIMSCWDETRTSKDITADQVRNYSPEVKLWT